MIDIKKNACKLELIVLIKSETHLEEIVLPEDGIYKYLYRPG